MKFKLLALSLLACAASAAPRLIFIKEFPGSAPPYVLIRLDTDGKGEYLESEDDDQPIKFKLQPAEAAAMFQLAEKLEHFKHPLESGLKVANMGKKTLRWDNGGETSEQAFNYSTDLDVQALQDWFEKISESANRYIDLQRRARFDRLGVNHSLLLLETAWDKKRLVGLDQFLPLLDRVANNDSYLNMARERAAKLAEMFRADLQKPADAQPAGAKANQ
ncbi:MAG: hypothetical protein IT161_15225 [Bryobacterales bacterium]|nr:hypothetical protein [Bryobacterales bacterium]